MRYGQGDEIYAVRPITEIVGQAIARLGEGETFTVQQIAKDTPFFRRHVKQIIREKARQGILVKVKYGVYQKVTPGTLTDILPMGQAANATWAALQMNSATYSSFTQIADAAEEIINRPTHDCRGAIGGALSTWVKAGFVERIGPEPGKYQYKVKDGHIQRPPLKRKYKKIPATLP